MFAASANPAGSGGGGPPPGTGGGGANGGGLIGIHHNSASPLASIGSLSSQSHPSPHHPSLPVPSVPSTPAPNHSSLSANSPVAATLQQPQPSDPTSVIPIGGTSAIKRPVGLNLAAHNSIHNSNMAASNGFPYYSSVNSAPLPPGPPGTLHQSSSSPAATLLQRNASFSSFNLSQPPNSAPPISTPASAPPSASMPPFHHSPSGSIPNQQQAHQLQPSPVKQPAALPHVHRPGSIPPHLSKPDGNSSTVGHDAIRGTPLVRPSTTSSSLPTGAPSVGVKQASADHSATVPSPVSLASFPGLGFSTRQNVPPANQHPPNKSSPMSASSSDASRFFNTYLYDYLLKQGLYEVARVFVTSGAELELIDVPDRPSVRPQGAYTPKINGSTPHKRRRSDGSPSALHSSPTQVNHPAAHGGPNDCPSSGNSKGGNASSELLSAERTMSSSGSTVSNTSHYGFNSTDSSKSTHETPGSQPSAGDSLNHQSSSHAPNGINPSSSGASAPSPGSSPRPPHALIESLPKPKLAMDTDQGFLFEWWTIFWDVFRAKTGRNSAPAQPAQLYAQTIAAASLGLTGEGGSAMTKARREALGIVAVPNPMDIQKGYLNERIQQQYTIVNANVYPAHHPELGASGGVRLLPQHAQHQKQAFLAEQNRQQQFQRLQQHQQAQLQLQMHQQALSRQRSHHQTQQEVPLQPHRQSELNIHPQHLQPHQHAQPLHQLYPEQFAAQQRQMAANARRPVMLNAMGQEQVTGMMPPPPSVQQGSPLNPHQQSFRPSRPPSRSSVALASGSFANHAHSQVLPQPHRDPGGTSNQANSPALQSHPRTPSSTHPATPQAVSHSNQRRESPTPSVDEQDRKKRRLNEQPGPPNVGMQQMPETANGHSQQLQQAIRHQQMTMGQQPPQSHPIQTPRRSMTSNSDMNGSLAGSSPRNSNLDAYKQSMHLKHHQPVAPGNLAHAVEQKPVAPSTPSKATDDSSMPPPSGRAMSQAPTPQASGISNRTMDQQSTPLPTIVASSPGRPQSTPSTSHNPEITVQHEDSRMNQESSGSLSQNQGQGTNGTEQKPTNGMSNHGDDQVRPKNDHPWLAEAQALTGTSPPAIGGANNTSTTTDDSSLNTSSMDQLFGQDGLPFDIDAKLFEAFINYDPTAPGDPSTEYR